MRNFQEVLAAAGFAAVLLGINTIAQTQTRPAPAAPDIDEAFKLFKDIPLATVVSQCERKNPVACFVAAGTYHGGTGGDLVRALGLYKLGCDGGYALSCYNAASMHEKGEGTPRDLSVSAALYQRACDGGDRMGCNNLGRMYGQGNGVVKDEAKAAGLLQRSCELGFSAACANAGVIYAKGVTRDDARAVGLFRRACDAGNAGGCNWLAFMTENGRGVATNRTVSMDLYRKACAGGNQQACDSVKRLNSPATASAPRVTVPPPSTTVSNLKPTDIILERQPHGYITVLVGKTLQEALQNQVNYFNRTVATVSEGSTYFSCAQKLNKMTVGWWALVSADHRPLRPMSGQTEAEDHTWGMACGAATLEQALAIAYDAAKDKAKGASKSRPFGTYWVQAGVTAEVDRVQLSREGRLANWLPHIPWATQCNMPTNLEQAKASGVVPQDLGNGQAFAKYLLSPALKFREYTWVVSVPKKEWLGCWPFVHTPQPNQPPPVFTPR